jgi:hypothetical protein
VERHRAGDGLNLILNETAGQTLHFPENSIMTCALNGLTAGNLPPVA